MKILKTLRLKSKPKDVGQLYALIVAQARQPVFYNVLGVPDTVNGRYDVIVLHAYFVMKRLKELGPEAGSTSQALFDYMFLDMDKNLREMGIGDLSVGKKIKAMATAFYGRIKAYDEGLEAGNEQLANSLRRNIFVDSEPAETQITAMTNFISDQVRLSSSWSFGDIENAKIKFITPASNDSKI